MTLPISTYLTGKCHPCKRVFRWETRSRTRVLDAICLGCDGPLIRTKRRYQGVPVEHVDAEWVQQHKGPIVDPDDPATWA